MQVDFIQNLQEKNAAELAKHKANCNQLLSSVQKVVGSKASSVLAAQQMSQGDQPRQADTQAPLSFDSNLLRDMHTEQNQEMNKLKKMMAEVSSAEEQQRSFREILEKFIDHNTQNADEAYDLSSYESVKK